jgi:hypothetical protein
VTAMIAAAIDPMSLGCLSPDLPPRRDREAAEPGDPVGDQGRVTLSVTGRALASIRAGFEFRRVAGRQSPASFNWTIRAKFGGVSGSCDTTRSTASWAMTQCGQRQQATISRRFGGSRSRVRSSVTGIEMALGMCPGARTRERRASRLWDGRASSSGTYCIGEMCGAERAHRGALNGNRSGAESERAEPG